jgi:hypothetical protein
VKDHRLSPLFARVGSTVDERKFDVPPAKKPAKRAAKTTGAKRGGQALMSADHKAALAGGREAAKAVRAYLDALETSKPRRGRQRDPKTIQSRLGEIEQELTTASAFDRLHLLAEQERLQASQNILAEPVNLTELRKAFLANAKSYANAKGISYAAWRGAGVSAEDLKAAGIARRTPH